MFAPLPHDVAAQRIGSVLCFFARLAQAGQRRCAPAQRGRLIRGVEGPSRLHLSAGLPNTHSRRTYLGTTSTHRAHRHRLFTLPMPSGVVSSVCLAVGPWLGPRRRSSRHQEGCSGLNRPSTLRRVTRLQSECRPSRKNDSMTGLTTSTSQNGATCPQSPWSTSVFA